MADTQPEQVKKIAVIGGGAGALTAVYELTNVPDWQSHYEITVYQVGWRLGGKGASGRNRNAANRIEEHGFHIWWGFYDNAFRMIQRCYDEIKRPLNKPLATWNEAFKPIYYDAEFMHIQHKWIPHLGSRPMNDSTPGQDIDKPLPNRGDYLYLLLNSVAEGVEAASEAGQQSGMAGILMGVVKLWLQIARWLAWLPHKHTSNPLSRLRYALIDAMLGIFIAVLWLAEKDKIQAGNAINNAPSPQNIPGGRQQQNINASITFASVDMACAMIRGMIRDDIITRGFDVANELDFRAWLGAHGARANPTLKSFLLQGIYDMVFASYGEDTGDLEAGTLLRILMRSYFTYKGAYLWRMTAGMGDVVFAPLYQALHARGVKFKFFHRVDKLHLNEAGTSIAAITIERQATVNGGGEYQPLFDVNGLPCWPSEPLYEQLAEGDQLQEKILVAGQWIPKYNLESFWTPWKGHKMPPLRAGHEFDIVVLGVSLGSLPWLCSELIEREGPQWEKWRTMLKHLTTVPTQVFQLWLKPDIAGLGWPLWKYDLPVMDAYDSDPTTVDSWADMSHLIMREDWPKGQLPGNISYFIGTLAKPRMGDLPPPEHHDYPVEQFERCKDYTLRFLRQRIDPLWPAATAPDGPHPKALNWELLVDLDNRAGEERLNSQFWKINIDPSELYVLFPSGSTKYRLRTDESGCDNLFLTGDWIYNGANAGYVESAVMSGMLTAQAITRRLLGRAWPERIVGWPSD